MTSCGLISLFGAISKLLLPIVGIIVVFLVYELNRQKFRLELLGHRKKLEQKFIMARLLVIENPESQKQFKVGEYEGRNFEAMQRFYFYANDFKNSAGLFDDRAKLAISELLSFGNALFEAKMATPRDAKTVAELITSDKLKEIDGIQKTMFESYFNIHEPPSMSELPTIIKSRFVELLRYLKNRLTSQSKRMR